MTYTEEELFHDLARVLQGDAELLRRLEEFSATCFVRSIGACADFRTKLLDLLEQWPDCWIHGGNVRMKMEPDR
jgi:hypothetical protein